MKKLCPYCLYRLTRKDVQNGLICTPGGEIYNCPCCKKISGGPETFTLDDFPERKRLVEAGIKELPVGIPRKKIFIIEQELPVIVERK